MFKTFDEKVVQIFNIFFTEFQYIVLYMYISVSVSVSNFVCITALAQATNNDYNEELTEPNQCQNILNSQNPQNLKDTY